MAAKVRTLGSDAAAQLDCFISGSPDLIAIVTFSGRAERISPTWARTLGYGLQEIRDTATLDWVHPDDLEATLEQVTRSRAGTAMAGFRTRCRTRTGDYRLLEWSGHADQATQRFYLTARDVTDAIAQEKALVEQTENLEAFAFMIAHDVRSPLRAVAGLGGLLQREYAKLATQQMRSLLDTMMERIRSIDDMVGGLLAFARLGEGALETRPVDMEEIVDGLIQMMAESGQRVDHIERLPLPPCVAEPLLVQEALGNLINNAALHAVKPDATIVITGHIADGYAHYLVHDSGPGVRREDMARIWQPLATGRSGGTGLGLPIVKRIAEAHGGYVSCESMEGSGATFAIAIPLGTTHDLSISALTRWAR